MSVRAVFVLLALGAGFAGPPGDANAQDSPRVTVRVRQVAGSTIYLDVGTRHGLATGDTLAVARDSIGEPVGTLVVTASTEDRAVLTFAAVPFAVARGDLLTLRLLRQPAETPMPVASRPAPAVTAAAAGREREPAGRPAGRARGRIGIDMSAQRSITQVGGSDPTDIERTYATPALRFDVTIPRAVGGFQLRTSMRVAHRYSGQDLISPATSTRVYAATLEREFTEVPFRILLGRFSSPVESYSGYWDGALVRYGGRGFGVGAIAGFQPERWNERPSTELPKVTGFVDWEGRGEGWRWQGDISAHTLRPADSLTDHTYLGLSQRILVGPLRLYQDLQVDRDPLDGGWKVSRVRVRGSVALSPNLELRVGGSRRERFRLGTVGNFFAPSSNRVDAGLAVRGHAGFLSAGASMNKDGSGQTTRGATSSYSLTRLPGFRSLGTAGSVSWWSGPYGKTLSAAPALTMSVRPAWLQLGYRFNRSDYLERVSKTHAGEASLHVPFGRGMRASARLRIQWGGALRNEAMNVSISKVF